jgi:drug/metabolite transporter (DMT)-like permease
MTSAAPAQSSAVPATARAGVPWTDVSLVAMAVIWGANFAVMKLGASQFPPLAFNALRLASGTLVLLAMAFAKGGAWPRRETVRRLMLYGIIGNGLYQVFFVEALMRTSIANVAIMIASTPIWLALLGQVTGTERLSTRAWWGIALSFAGIGLVLFAGGNGPGSQHSWTGDLLAICGTAAWCTYTVLLRPLTQETDPIPLHALTLVGGSVPLLLVALPELAATPWATVSAGGWAALAYGAIMAIVVAYLLWYRGVRLIGPTRTAMYANLQPIVALVVAALMLGEVPTATQGVGCAFTVAGLLLTRS